MTWRDLAQGLEPLLSFTPKPEMAEEAKAFFRGRQRRAGVLPAEVKREPNYFRLHPGLAGRPWSEKKVMSERLNDR